MGGTVVVNGGRVTVTGGIVVTDPGKVTVTGGKVVVEPGRVTVVPGRVTAGCVTVTVSVNENSYEKMMEQIRNGITGFLDMDESPIQFFSELNQLATGNIVISKKFVHNLRQKVRIRDQVSMNLSNRELQILELLTHGNSNKEIGKELFLSEHTVKVHLRSILNKLNLKNRQQAIAYALRKSMISK